MTRICLPITADGAVDDRWGRAERVAVAEVDGGAVLDWQEIDVGWAGLHDVGTEGAHHARVARFLRDQQVDVVVVREMGLGMARMLGRLGLQVRLGVTGEARAAATSGGA